MTPLHHTKRAFFDQVPGKAPNGNAPFSFSFIIDTFPSKEKRKKNDFNEKEAALAVQRSTFRQTRFPTDLAKE
ncbi:hypothetical protein DI44_16735 [Geobacillus sp. CAMR5420]|nr:hypothetical protein DI44_16735 [Geobacillus sp. CAMR5420]